VETKALTAPDTDLSFTNVSVNSGSAVLADHTAPRIAGNSADATHFTDSTRSHAASLGEAQLADTISLSRKHLNLLRSTHERKRHVRDVSVREALDN